MVLVAIVLAALNVSATPCREGEIRAGSDAELRALAGVTCLRGWLRIEGDVSSLAPLRALTVIEGSLYIGRLDRLRSLRGLDALTRVTEDVVIGGPKNGLPAMRHVDGLPALTEIGGDLTIASGYIFRVGASRDAPLYGVSGLRALKRVKGSVKLHDLHGFDGLDALVEIDGVLEISGRSLPGLGGFRRLRRIGGLDIEDERPRHVRGLDALVEIGGNVEVNCGGDHAPRLQQLVRRQLADVTIKGHVRYGAPEDPDNPGNRCPEPWPLVP